MRYARTAILSAAATCLLALATPAIAQVSSAELGHPTWMRKVQRRLHDGADPELRLRRHSCDRAGARDRRPAHSVGAGARNEGGGDAKDTPREASVRGPR
jgi:hypothetical protein